MQNKNRAHAHQGPTEIQNLIIYAALVLLTFATVGLSRAEGIVQSVASLCGFSKVAVSTLFALAIAAFKAFLVLSIFMHLKYEKPLLWGVFFFSLVLAFVFMAGTAPDIAFH